MSDDYADYWALQEHRSVPPRVAQVVGYHDGKCGVVAQAFAEALGRPDASVQSMTTVNTLWTLMTLVGRAFDQYQSTVVGTANKMAMQAIQDLTHGEALTVLEELDFGDLRLPEMKVMDAAPALRSVLAQQLTGCLNGRFDFDWKPFFRKPRTG